MRQHVLSLFLVTAWSLIFAAPVWARSLTPEEALQYKKELRDADLEYLSQLREKLLEINNEYTEKFYALRVEVAQQTKDMRSPSERRPYGVAYREKLKQLKEETVARKAAVKKDLNGDRLVKRGIIQREYEPEVWGGTGIRG